MGPGRSGGAYSRVYGAATAKGSELVTHCIGGAMGAPVMRRQDPHPKPTISPSRPGSAKTDPLPWAQGDREGISLAWGSGSRPTAISLSSQVSGGVVRKPAVAVSAR